MNSQFTSKHSKRYQAFQSILKQIESFNWKSILQKSNKLFNIKAFNLEKLTPEKVRELYQRIHERFYLCQRSRDGVWIKNQLRIFIWMLILTSEIDKTDIELYSTTDWQLIAGIFEGKSIQTCKFQYKTITNNKVTPWNIQQEELLTKIIDERNEIELNWNQISRDFFNLSAQKYFKTSKQCRQHWNNYLNPKVCKKKWNIKQDYLLMKHVVQKGKKWAIISKILQSRRTQHMVKNRFKSIILTNSREFGISKKHSESHSVLQKIYNKIKNEYLQVQQLQMNSQKQMKQIKQIEHPVIKSAFQFVTIDSPCDSTTLGIGSSPGFSPYQTYSFQIPVHQLFSQFMIPYQFPILNFSRNVKQERIFDNDCEDSVLRQQ